MDMVVLRKGLTRFAAIVALGLALATAAVAQSSSGNIIGMGKAGDTVVVQGPDNGFHREMKLDEDGKYQVRRVPLGDYTVVIKHADGTFSPAQTVTVRPGGTARIQ